MGRISLTREKIAFALVTFGGLLTIAGIALVYVPAALVVAGAGLVALGLFGIEVDK